MRPTDTAARGPKGHPATSTPPGVEEAAEITLTFEDNRLAGIVFGQFDQNLAHIERRLGVVATANGNRVVIRGEPESTEHGRRVLENLYDRARSGAPLSQGDVDGAIQESRVQGTLFAADEAPAAGRTAFDHIATRKRGPVRARNATQNAYIKALKQHELVFAEGPAGTGKTWLAVGHAGARRPCAPRSGAASATVLPARRSRSGLRGAVRLAEEARAAEQARRRSRSSRSSTQRTAARLPRRAGPGRARTTTGTWRRHRCETDVTPGPVV